MLIVRERTPEGETAIPVVGRLAFVIGLLVAERERLAMDEIDYGQLHISWGAGELRVRVDRHLPPVSEPS